LFFEAFRIKLPIGQPFLSETLSEGFR